MDHLIGVKRCIFCVFKVGNRVVSRRFCDSLYHCAETIDIIARYIKSAFTGIDMK